MSIFQVNKAVQAAIGQVIAGRPQVYSDPDPSIHPEPGGSLFGGSLDRLMESVRPPGDRLKEMDYYDYLEDQIADVPRALDAFATMACTGNLAGGGTSTFIVKPKDVKREYPKELLARLKRIEALISINSFHTIREMTKYGSYMPQNVVGPVPEGGQGVVRIRPMPPGTIFRKVDKNGESDPAKYWEQRIEGRPVVLENGESKSIPQWVLPHFALWRNLVNARHTLLYGTSILRPFGAIGLKVAAMQDAMVVSRLSRASMRYKWKIDCGDILKDQAGIMNRLKQWQRSVGRGTDLLGSSGVDGFQKAAIPDADFFVPVGEKLQYDVETLAGDANLPRVQDVELMLRFYFGALGMPPEYLGHERSQGGRSVLSQIDIQFARNIRHIQMFGASGFEHIVYVDMVLGGYDPREWPVECVPPQIGARDDLLQAQIRALQANVIATLATAGMDVNVAIKWVLETFMDLGEELRELDEKQLTKLFRAASDVDAATGTSKGNGSRGTTARERKEMFELIAGNTRHLVSMIADNVRLLDDHPYNNGIYRNGHPTPEEIADQIDVRDIQ